MKPSVGMTDRCLGVFGHLDNLTLHFFFPLRFKKFSCRE